MNHKQRKAWDMSSKGQSTGCDWFRAKLGNLGGACTEAHGSPSLLARRRVTHSTLQDRHVKPRKETPSCYEPVVNQDSYTGHHSTCF